MTARVTWLLAIVLALGALDATLAFLDRTEESAREVHPGDPLVTFAPPGIAKVVCTRAGKKPLVLARSQGTWVVASAKDFPARQGKVEQTLARILGWRRDRVAGDASAHEKFAVTKEKGISVRLEDFSGQTVAEIVVGSLTGIDPEEARQKGGNVDPHALGRYMRVAREDAVYVVADFLTGELEPDPQEWLEKPITGGDEAKARALVLRHKTGEQLAILFDPPYARLATGDQRPVDGERAHALLRAVTQAWAIGTTDGEDSKLGLEPPLLQAEVLLAEGTKPIQLLLGDPVPPADGGPAVAVAARVPEKPGPLLVPQGAVAALFSATAESVALAHVLGEKAAPNVSKLALREGEKTITLAREANAWTVSAVSSGVAPAPRKLESTEEEPVKRAAQTAVSLAVEAFDRQGLQSHGLADPRETLTVELQSGRERFIVLFGAQEGALVWVKRSDLACALAVSADAIAELRAAFASLAR